MRAFTEIERDIDALVEMPLAGETALGGSVPSVAVEAWHLAAPLRGTEWSSVAVQDRTVPTRLAMNMLLSCGEDILEAWVASRGETPTTDQKEGFRLLALQRQGAKGEPSFNACRETCRELAYHYNLVTLDPAHPDASKRVHMAALVARHLLYFVEGKLTAAGLGEFCCSSKPVRADG